MRAIISVVGKSGSGKTTLLEKLIGELNQRGHRVGIIKHSHHANDLDTADKDTWRFTRAGSEFSAINSLDHLAVYRRIDHYFDPREISDSILWDYDLVLTEGFKGCDYPKIEVHRGEQGHDLLTAPEKLLAVVTDEPLDVDIPQLAPDDITGIADVIENNLDRPEKENDIGLVVNGDSVELEPGLEDLLARTLCAMVPGSPNGHDIKSLHVSLRRKA